MTESNKAVFLSYASQDAQAAARICEALRSAGIEVWFDQSELRGGDAWDQKIHQQIRDCVLFVPVISGNTQARLEGYFRREWKLAVSRTHDMADEKPFLVPVVIDNTNDQDAHVPEAFRAVQWTRLLGGETSAGFCERVRVLLGNKEPGAKTQVGAGSAPTVLPRRASGRWKIALAVGVAVAVMGGWQLWSATQTKRMASAPVAPATKAVPEKSIAVLPFVDMSEKHDQEYFSDGLSEELIDRLAHNADLKVIARTSSFAFKGKSEDMRVIATKLGVANLLEGSVRSSGVELRITAQLIRASDGVHLWSQTYERKLNDVFKLQDEISGTVAKALNVALSTGTQSTMPGTTSVEAYNLVLQGNFFKRRFNRTDNEHAVTLFKQAIAIDPHYAFAWAKLANTYLNQIQSGWAMPVEGVAKARDALNHALNIDPDLYYAHYTLSAIHMGFEWDWKATQMEIDRMRAIDPHEPEFLPIAMSQFAAIFGRLGAAIELDRQVLERDPLNAGAYFDLANNLFMDNQYAESVSTFRRLLLINPSHYGAYASIGNALLFLHRNDEALAAIEKESDDTVKLSCLPVIYWAMGRRSESDAALKTFQTNHGNDSAYGIAETYAYRGEVNGAFEWLDRAYRQRDPIMTLLKIDPWLESLHSDPRFKVLLRKMNLPET